MNSDNSLTIIKSNDTTLLPERRMAQNHFVADIFVFAMKGDVASMELPIFTLSTQPDMKILNWTSRDNKKNIEVTPSAKGRATMFDKDILIFVVSQLTEGINRGREDTMNSTGRFNRTIRFRFAEYLKSTGKRLSGAEYMRAEKSLDRLAGTRIKTNIATGERVIKKNFGLIEQWTIVEKSMDNEKTVGVEVVISEWLYNSIKEMEVLTLNKKYFQLRKPIERRIYEIAKKYCGQQTSFIIGLDLLQSKINPVVERKHFKAQLLATIKAKTIPDYFLNYDPVKDQVIIHYMKSKDRKFNDGYGFSGDDDFFDDSGVIVGDVSRSIKRKYRVRKLTKLEQQVKDLKRKRRLRSNVDLVHYENNPNNS